MKIQDIINTQYMVLAMTDKLELDKDSNSFKNFKRRIFENVEYLEKVEDEL